MFNLKTVSILLLLTFVASVNIYASNIGRAVYGVLTETYCGISIDNSSAGDDYGKIYGNTYSITSEKIEGNHSNSISSAGWFCVSFYSAQSMSAYSGGRIYFSLLAPSKMDVTDTGNAIKISDGTDRPVYFNSTNIKRIDTGSSVLGTGVVADGNWHTYYIELSSFQDLNLSNITALFVISSTVTDNSVFVDNVYWTKSGSKSFDVTIKNISNNSTASNVSWSEEAFRKSWIAADQYLELDLDQGSSNWYIQIYADNGKKGRNGLYCVKEDETEDVLPMAWRIVPETLPNSSGDTLQIARYQSGSYGLYDSGKNPSGTDWYTWCPIRELKDGIDNNDVIVWNLSGIHTVVWDHNSWDSLANFYERKPKIYLAADCSKALGGLIYNANIVVRLSYE